MLGKTIDETAVDGRSAKNYPGYSVKTIEAVFKENALTVKNAFPDKSVIQWINFPPYDLVEFIAWFVQNGIGIGNPNTKITHPFYIDAICPLFIKYHNKVPTSPRVSCPDQSDVTAEQLLSTAILGTRYYL